MPEISMDLVKKLREKTQVGMMDCKKALQEANGDLEKAVELLRKKGAAVAAKRAEHETNNGRIETFISNDFKEAALLKVVCETDFSANTDAMKEFVLAAAQGAVVAHNDNKVTLLENNKPLRDTYEELLAKISERIEIDTICLFKVKTYGLVTSYIHPGSTVGTMIEFETEVEPSGHLEELKAAGRDVCMQIAVTNPTYLRPEDVPADQLEKERSIAKEQVQQSGKPAAIAEKIVENKIKKYYTEVCLTEQGFIKDESMSINQYLEKVSAKLKNKITLKRFARLAIGR